MRSRFLIAPVLAGLLVSLSSFSAGLAQEKSRGKQPFDSTTKSKTLPTKATEMKKYDEVITKDFVTQPGVFAVHRLDEKIHFEIPQEAFGRLMLWYGEVAK